ncbi:Uncharacterised protein [Chlamydia trachomatis]|nr:Uncharacterised protein [Chlamydia trachomatis]
MTQITGALCFCREYRIWSLFPTASTFTSLGDKSISEAGNSRGDSANRVVKSSNKSSSFAGVVITTIERLSSLNSFAMTKDLAPEWRFSTKDGSFVSFNKGKLEKSMLVGSKSIVLKFC